MNWLSEKAWDIVAGVIKGLWESIIGPFDDLNGLKTLIFNKYEDGERIYGTFTSSEITNTIAPGVQSMSYIVGFFLVLGIIFMGAKISNTGLNPSNRTMFLEFIRDWVIACLVIANIGYFYEMLFQFNSAIVGIMDGELIDKLDDKLMPDLKDSGLVGWIVIGLFMVGTTVWANFYYIMREITLMVFMVLGPVFLALYIFPATKGVTMAWLKELFGTIMIQSVHAVTFFTIASIGRGGDSGVIQLTIMYLVVIPTGEAVKSLLNLGGDTTGRLGRFAAMAGMAGMSGVFGAVKSAKDGKGFGEVFRNATGMNRNGGSNGDNGENGTSGASIGPIAGADSRASRMLKAGEIVSKAGKMAIGSGGSIAGAVMGPEGAMIGGALGSMAGGYMGGKLGRAGVGAKDKIGNALSKNNGRLGDAINSARDAKENEYLADNLAKLKTDDWAKANKDDFMQAHGGNKDAEDKWNQVLAKQHKKFKREAKDALTNGSFAKNYAKASDLAEQMAQEKLSNSLQKHGRDEFVSKLPAGMSQEDIDKSWDAEKAKRLGNYRKDANNIAKQLVGNKPLDSFVNKDDFLQKYQGNEMAKIDSKESQFRSNFQKQNPTASPQEIDDAWNGYRSDQLKLVSDTASRIGKNAVSVIPSLNGNERKAADLVASAADSMTKDWATATEQPFKEKQRAVGIQKIEQEVEKDWDQQVSQVQSNNRKQAQLDTKNWASQNEQSLKSTLMRDNPNLSPQQLDTSFQKLVDGKLNENIKQADNQTQGWVNANEQSVKEGLKQSKMQGLEQSVNGKWKEAIKQQANSNYNFASGIAQKVSGGQSLSAFVDRNDFANELASSRIGQAKENFVKANPGLEGAAFDNAWKPIEKSLQQDSMNAVASVAPRSISRGYGTKTALASQFATQATENWAKNPQNRKTFEDKFTQDFDSANKALKEGNPSAYQAKLKDSMGQGWNKVVGDVFSKNMQSAEDALLVDTSSNGVVIPNTVGNVVSGAKAFSNSMRQSSEGVIKRQAFKNATGNYAQRKNASIRAVYDHRYGADTPVEVKAKAYRDDVAYKAGVIGGVNGYQNKANKVMNMKKNPFANQMYQSAHEVADIARMAKTETIDLPNGQQQTRVAKGAVQLVVEKDRSYIQVETQDGQFKTVSQYGAGDSDLEQGTVLFKDYTIENQELVPSSSSRNPNSNGFYAKDTAGHKITANRKVNIDANSLLQSRRHINNQETEPRHNAYNFKVEQGQFDLNDIKAHSADHKAVLVVEQNRSYVAMTGEDNQMYRVSPIQNVGNSNLQNGEVIYKEYAVEGGQLRERSIEDSIQLKTYSRTGQGKEIVVDSSEIPSSINVNELILPPKNKRYSRRQQMERQRTTSGAYL